ncbi:MAG: hypothetical protein SCK70_07700 [bacterium]|nr:hypothetical protein [bacterium]
MELTLQDILEDLHAAENKCQEFEKKYGVRSEFFFDAYSNGWLNDEGNPDFAEWSGFDKSKLDREKRYRALILQRSSVLRNLKNIKFDATKS